MSTSRGSGRPLSRSRYIRPVVAAAVMAGAYMVYTNSAMLSDPDDPIVYPMRRAARRMLASKYRNRNTTVNMIADKDCNLGRVLYYFIKYNKYPSDKWTEVEPTDAMPTSKPLCDAIDTDASKARLGAGSYGYVQSHPSNPEDLVYKREHKGRSELKHEARVMSLLNELDGTPNLIAWCPEQNAIVSERMEGSLLEENSNWLNWSLAAQMNLVHAPMRSKLMTRENVSAKAAIAVYLDLLHALKGMHDMNTVHRDIHAGNIMFNPRLERWVLIDLGLSGKANATYRSLDLASVAIIILSLVNLIDLDWADLVVETDDNSVRWIDAHPARRFRNDRHKGRDWNRVFDAILASMTLKPSYPDVNDLIRCLGGNDGPIKTAEPEPQPLSEPGPPQASISKSQKRKRQSDRFRGVFKRTKKSVAKKE